MNYLQLSVKTRQECDASGVGPAAVTNQSGESLRIVGWVADAWKEIQTKRSGAGGWRWMRKGFTFNTVIGTSAYAYTVITDVPTSAFITRFSEWYVQSVKAYLQSAGVGAEYPLRYMPWEAFRRYYRYGTQTNGQPQHVSVDPDGQLCVGPAPEAVYVVSGDYQRSAQVLAANTDTPELPTDYELLIVYEAMKKYAGYESAHEVWTRANNEANKIWPRLEIRQLPQIIWGDPLA